MQPGYVCNDERGKVQRMAPRSSARARTHPHSGPRVSYRDGTTHTRSLHPWRNPKRGIGGIFNTRKGKFQYKISIYHVTIMIYHCVSSSVSCRTLRNVYLTGPPYLSYARSDLTGRPRTLRNSISLGPCIWSPSPLPLTQSHLDHISLF